MTSASPADPRRKARAVALQALFAVDLRGGADEAPLEWLLLESPLPRKAVSFAGELVHGVRTNLSELDRLIHKYAPAWPVQQLSAVDRNILRLALYELLYRSEEVPRKTAVNEAVELAKVFGSESSSRFINGVAGSVIADLESGALKTDQLVSEGR